MGLIDRLNGERNGIYADGEVGGSLSDAEIVRNHLKSSHFPKLLGELSTLVPEVLSDGLSWNEDGECKVDNLGILKGAANSQGILVKWQVGEDKESRLMAGFVIEARLDGLLRIRYAESCTYITSTASWEMQDGLLEKAYENPIKWQETIEH